MVLRAGGRTHQLFAAAPLETGAPMTAVVPLDRHFRARAEATWRFRRDITGAGSRASGLKPDARLDRVRLAIRAIDARSAGVSYRMLACALFGKRRVETEDWKTSSLRGTTIRLARTGARLVNGGYLKLLGRKSE